MRSEAKGAGGATGGRGGVTFPVFFCFFGGGQGEGEMSGEAKMKGVRERRSETVTSEG
jgi:hypothetical protein